jgi:4,5-dihydroxyphthalate decarboxylase
VREVHRLLAGSAAASSAASRFSPDEMRRSLELIIDYSAQQKLVPRAFTADELFNDVTRALW